MALLLKMIIATLELCEYIDSPFTMDFEALLNESKELQKLSKSLQKEVSTIFVPLGLTSVEESIDEL